MGLTNAAVLPFAYSAAAPLDARYLQAYSAPLIAAAPSPYAAFRQPIYAARAAPLIAAPAPAPIIAARAAPLIAAAAPAPIIAARAAPVIAASPAPVIAARATEFADAYPQYQYAYNVNDALTGDSKTQEESREGDVVRGSYSLIEADGSRRIVNYYADPINGFNAVVSKDVPVVAAAGPAVVAAKTVLAPAPAAAIVA